MLRTDSQLEESLEEVVNPVLDGCDARVWLGSVDLHSNVVLLLLLDNLHRLPPATATATATAKSRRSLS